MIISCPLPLTAAKPARWAQETATDNPGSWRYDGQRRARGPIVFAALLSAGLHAALIFGVGRTSKKAAPVQVADVAMIQLTIPEVKELEEPEPIASDEPRATSESPTLVPMQADLPQISSPSDFVQPIDFSTLIERPDFSQMKILAIPESIQRGGGRIAQSIGAIFNLADLDRIPEPIFQPPPSYPLSMRRDGLSGSVVVEFVVDAQGHAVNAVAVDSTASGFNEAAIAGVLKWKFRPGIRGGRKVNTRMRVPISFQLADEFN